MSKITGTRATGTAAAAIGVVHAVEEVAASFGIRFHIDEQDIVYALAVVGPVAAWVGLLIRNWRAGRRLTDTDGDGVADLLETDTETAGRAG